jgi:putative hydrolase of HD superfamily
MTHTRPDIQRLLEFHTLLTSFAEIERVIHLKRRGKVELESDTEHSYNLAMMAWFLAPYFPELAVPKVIMRALVHDLVEVHAGDTFVFADQAHLDSKDEREAAAQKQLAADWPDFTTLHETIADYEAQGSPEARFVYALDKIIPMFTVYLNDGITWQERQMSLERLHAEKRQKISAFEGLLTYWDELYELLLQSPQLFPSDMLQ